MNHLIKIFFFILITTFNYAYAKKTNEILFIVNDKAFTTLDLEIRKNYLKVILMDSEIENQNFINTILFNEEFDKKKFKLDKDMIDLMFSNIKENYENTNNDQSLKNIYLNLSKKQIIKNIELDYKKKIILERILNTKRDIIFSKEISDFFNLYDVKVHYYSFSKIQFEKLKKLISGINYDEILKKIDLVKSNDVEYIHKERKIINSSKINSSITKSLQNNEPHFFINNKNNIIIGKIYKILRSDKNIKYTIYEISSEIELLEKNIKCKNIAILKNNKNIIIKENKNISYDKLNNEIKNNLNQENDYIKIPNKNMYLLLCNIDFDRKFFRDINVNQKIEFLVKEIENEFFLDKSKVFKLIILKNNE
jgi:hypothetical protein